MLLGNFVFETQTPSLIRAFLTSSKTKKIFNSISLSEKQKFIQFTIKSLEQQIVGDTDSQQNMNANASFSQFEEAQAAVRKELEQILNVEMLSQPPFSLVNITENLLPLSIDATFHDLKTIVEQYQQSPESQEVLELSLKNLQGEQGSPQDVWKWTLNNTNQIWAKKLCGLILDLRDDDEDLFDSFKCLGILLDDIFDDIAAKAE